MKYVYVAGPYSKPVPAQNVHKAIQYAERLFAQDLVPLVPHLSHFYDAIEPHDYEFWMSYSFNLIDRCDALLRIPGESPGADREVLHAKHANKPVFFSLKDLLQAARPEAIHGYR